MRFLSYFLVLALSLQYSFGQNPPWIATPFHPHAIPLAVRSPFLNSWIAGGNGSSSLSNQWPTLWDMSHILGWAIFVRVDGVAYRVMGAAPIPNEAQVANQTGFSFTATRSNFVHTAGPMTIFTSFISPIEPSDLVLQSLPAAYLAISVQSNDGNSHKVQVYSDISAEWISGNNDLTAIWGTNITSSSVIHNVQLENPQTFTVVNGHIQDATAYYGIANSPGVTWQTGPDADTRGQFMTQGKLLGTQDTLFRAVSRNFPVFGLSMDLGSLQNSKTPVVFALGLIRDPAVRALAAAGGEEERSLYFFTRFDSASHAMEFFISDFTRAHSASLNFDNTFNNMAASTSTTDYADLIALSARQVFGAVEITVKKDSKGNWDKNDVQAFMTDFGGSVNTVDIMYPAFPAFLRINPAIAGALLKPLLQWQQANGYPHPWAAHDFGTQYPVALGDSKDIPMPVEESGNMLIMTLAQAQASGDGTLIVNFYNVLDKWAQYLVSNAINPPSQSFTDSVLTGPVNNDVNLALKGIIGVEAMGKMASLVNNSASAIKYRGVSSGLLSHWLSHALSTDQSHLLLNFDNQTSSLSLPYNLYADKLLGFNMIPPNVYDRAAAQVQSQMQPYGVALDSRSSTAGKTDWSLFTAAALSSNSSVRDALIASVRAYAANPLGPAVPFSDFYDVSQGKSLRFQARPVQGAMFSILALQNPSKPISIPPPQPSNKGSNPTRSNSAITIRASNLISILTFALAIFANS